jgi:hypothetical protein
MAINATIYDTATLLGVIRDNRTMQPPVAYWLPLCFPNVINFTDEYIDFSKLSENRKLAPLVVPTAQGVPIYSAAERMVRVKPAYLKPKDPVTASRMIKRQAGFGELNANAPSTPQSRYNAIVADIMRQHRWSIERRWEWMAAQAIIEGEVILEDERYPRTVVNFGRASDQDVTLGGSVQWGDAGISIIASVASMRETMRTAPFGGAGNRITMGSDAWAKMQADDEIRELLNTDLRAFNNGMSLNLGLADGTGEVEFVGRLSGTVELVVYSDYYQDEDGDVVPFLATNDIVITGPNVQGYRCFGAIQDVAASFQALEIFPKMWNEEDPSATLIMNQSAPLMVPLNPNATFHATVCDAS